jgi:hypothetical protein
VKGAFQNYEGQNYTQLLNLYTGNYPLRIISYKTVNKSCKVYGSTLVENNKFSSHNWICVITILLLTLQLDKAITVQ